ncbi:alpha-2B adrenergic receptor-like [Dendronephthya gigantea]|uniref:alpha-2B adrenergic receptor-like n=1 Tax=Dendronephthya gigantea TaxID=151771 RepID=UPI0010695352|nr:alpha-2B adrenergic receptor-like [Dendronephthya gigantea]
MQSNITRNDSAPYFTRCLGIYHLLDRPSGSTLATYISVIVILSIFSVLTAVGNGLIMYVYVKQKSLQRTNTFLLVCLAFVDFVSAVVLEPLYVVRLLSEIFGFTSCVYVLIVRRLLEYLRPVSFMTLALTTIERYLALFKAITHRRMATKRRLFYAVLLSWFVWFLVIGIRSFFPSNTNAFYTFYTFIAFSLLVGNLFMYFKIGKLARLHSRPTRVSTTPGSVSAGYNTRTIDTGSLTVQGENPRPTNPVVLFSNTGENMIEGKRNLTEVENHESKSVAKESSTLSQLRDGNDLTKIHQVDANHNSSKEAEMKRQLSEQNSCDSEDKSEDKPVETTASGLPHEEDNITNDTEESETLKTYFKTASNEENSQEKLEAQAQNSAPPNSTGNSKHSDRKTTRESRRRNTKRVSFKNASKSVVETRERNATWTVFYIVAIITICYVPISALLVKLSFQKEPDATSLFIYVPIADTIALFNALVNPFVYCYKNRKMREAVKNVFQKSRSF